MLADEQRRYMSEIQCNACLGRGHVPQKLGYKLDDFESAMTAMIRECAACERTGFRGGRKSLDTIMAALRPLAVCRDHLRHYVDLQPITEALYREGLGEIVRELLRAAARQHPERSDTLMGLCNLVRLGWPK